MKETVYIRKKSPIFQAYDVNLHVVYRNPKAITEYDYVLDLQTIEQHDEDVRKETATDVIDDFVERLKELLTKYEHRSQTDGIPFYQMNAESFCDELNEIAAEYGAEVEK